MRFFATNLPSISTIASKLKEHDWCNKVAFPKVPADEPWMYLYQLQSSDENIRSLGYDFFEKETAGKRALSELIERHMWQHTHPNATSLKLASPEEVQMFTSERMKAQGSSKMNQVRTTRVKTLHRSIFSQAYIPAQICSGAYLQANVNQGSEPPLQSEYTTNGLATSWQARNEAILRGLLELIERDAFMYMYRNKLSAPKLSFDELATNSSRLAEICERVSRAKLKAVITLIPTDFPVQVVAVYIYDQSGKGPYFSVGAAARL